MKGRNRHDASLLQKNLHDERLQKNRLEERAPLKSQLDASQLLNDLRAENQLHARRQGANLRLGKSLLEGNPLLRNRHDAQASESLHASLPHENQLDEKHQAKRPAGKNQLDASQLQKNQHGKGLPLKGLHDASQVQAQSEDPAHESQLDEELQAKRPAGKNQRVNELVEHEKNDKFLRSVC